MIKSSIITRFHVGKLENSFPQNYEDFLSHPKEYYLSGWEEFEKHSNANAQKKTLILI